MKKICVFLVLLAILGSLFPINAFAQYSYPVVFINEKYRTVGDFEEDLLLVYEAFRQGAKYTYKYGYIDKAGKEVISLTYDSADVFSNGLAAVMSGGKCGYIDKTGTVVIPLLYDTAESFSDGLGRVCKDKQWYYINKTGKAIVGPLDYDRLDNFKDGFARVINKIGNRDYIGLIDHTGKEIIPPIYININDFHEGLAVILKSNYSCGVINTAGKLVIPFSYSVIRDFTDGVAVVGARGGFGLINKAGKIIVPLKYTNIDDFKDGLARVWDDSDKNNQRMGFMDKTGKMVIPLSHTAYGEFTDGLCAVGVKGEFTEKSKVGFIDTKGKLVIQQIYSQWTLFHSFQNGLAIVSNEDGICPKFGIIDKTGKEITPIVYDSIGNGDPNYPVTNEGLVIVAKDYNNGAVDYTGRLVIPMIFRRLTVFHGGLALGELDGRTCILENPLKNAQPTSSKVLVNGIETAFTSYGINGNNYFKLRDLSLALSGTTKQFDVGWDNARSAVILTSNSAYTRVGGELSSGSATVISALLNLSTIYLDGNQITLFSYLIYGNNFFKLRDIARIFDFYVGFDSAMNTIIIDTTKAYIEN